MTASNQVNRDLHIWINISHLAGSRDRVHTTLRSHVCHWDVLYGAVIWHWVVHTAFTLLVSSCAYVHNSLSISTNECIAFLDHNHAWRYSRDSFWTTSFISYSNCLTKRRCVYLVLPRNIQVHFVNVFI